MDMEDITTKKIKVIVPTKEELDSLESIGVDAESELVRAFREELHERIEKIKNNGREEKAK